MSNIKIESTLQNKQKQKTSIHNSSSAVFFVLYSGSNDIDTEISLLNHFLLKRGIKDVTARVEIRNIDGSLYKTFNIRMEKEHVYSIKLSEYVTTDFVGSIYVFFNSKYNLAVPFCAVTCSIKSKNSICSVHTYGRRLEICELDGSLDMNKTVEMGWTARDSANIKSFAVLHGGAYRLDLSIKLEVLNYKNKILNININHILNSYATKVLIPQYESDKIVSHLNGNKGHIKIYIDGLKGLFPRMLCGNFTSMDDNKLIEANEIQFTHTNFDFYKIKQPDANGNIGYFNQPSLENGYGIIYPVKTSKDIFVDGEHYKSNSLQEIKIKKMSQVKITARNENLPSRFIAAIIGKWKGFELESECSSGTFIEDYLRVPCHWHWGLLKPGFAVGISKISILMCKFDGKKNSNRKLNLRFFDNKSLLCEKVIYVKDYEEIDTSKYFKQVPNSGPIWFALTGDTLEDLNIYTTFYPKNRAGFVEHAF
jgi:cold shock CspA family protein